MTFSICVRERYETDTGESHHRFGVAVTTRLPGVGALCPFVSEHGAVATQSLVNIELGERGIEYVDEGLAIDDSVEALLNTDDGAPQRQVHGVDRDGSVAFSGEECVEWFGHLERDHATVAGNMLTGEDVLESVATTYEERAVHETTDRSTGPGAVVADTETEPLAKRLIDALAAGHQEGGDKREELTIQSAAVVVESTESHEWEPPYNDLRVDATETPTESLRETYDLAMTGYEATLERYSDAFEEDSLAEATD